MAAAVVIDMDYEENRPAGAASHECFVSVAIQLPPKSTAALYMPYRHGNDPDPGDHGVPDEAMADALREWVPILDTCGGVVVTVVFYADAAERLRSATLIFAASADAAMEGEGTPGIGGYVHGCYWRIQLPLVVLALFHITSWEFLASILTVFVAARLGGESALVAQQSDALLTTFALSNSHSRHTHSATSSCRCCATCWAKRPTSTHPTRGGYGWPPPCGWPKPQDPSSKHSGDGSTPRAYASTHT